MVASLPPSSSSLPVSLPLPPSERDFDFYEWIAVQGKDIREVAWGHGLSQSQAVQVLARVTEWIAQVAPAMRSLTPAERLHAATYLAERRMDHLYHLAIESYEKSRGQQVVVRSGVLDQRTTTTTSHGDVRYLTVAGRIAVEARRMLREDSASALAVKASRGAAGAEESAARKPEVDSRGSSPPKEDCSPCASPAADAPQASKPSVAASDDAAKGCDAIEKRRQELLAALNADTSPVQPPVTDRNGMLLDDPPADDLLPRSLPISCRERDPDASGTLSTDAADLLPSGEALLPLAAGAESLSRMAGPAHRHLNRKERRARQKRLEQALRRKAK